MYFIGQKHIMGELKVILPRAVEEPSFNISLLFKGRSGFGKTELGLKCCNFISGHNFMYTIASNKMQEFLEDKINRIKERVIFIDEIHLLSPEFLYPIMDQKNHFFVFATNLSSSLFEAFERRCVTLIFESYTREELREITRKKLGPEFCNVDDSFIDYVITSGQENPGKISLLCVRLCTLGIKYRIKSLEDLKGVMSEIINIQNGLDVRQRLYLEILERLETASLETISATTGFSKEIIKAEIEPRLLYLEKIKISPKGRSINND